MKRMFTVLAAALVVASASAQKEKNNPNYTQGWSNNIFLSLGGGGQVGLKSANYGDGFWRAVNPHVYIGVGKYINPLWSYRIEANGWRVLERSPRETRNFIGANIDAIYNLTNAFLGYNPDRVFELSAFAGPGATFTKGIRVNPVVSAGLQAKFNFNKYLSLDIEGRMAGQHEIVSNTQNRWYGTLTAGLSYTFGGKKFENCSKHDLCLAEQQRLNDQINADKSQISDLENQLAAAKRAAANKPAPVAPTVTKDCDPTAGPVAIFFEIGKWKLNPRDKANIQLAAKAIKADPNGKYSVFGYTDKATGTPKWNLKLSELRAKTVYDALVSEGVDPSQLEQKGMGEQPNMFTSSALNRVVIVKRK